MKFSGFINTDNGSNKILFKHYDDTNRGFYCYVSPTVSGNVTARIMIPGVSFWDVCVTGLASGYHTVTIRDDATYYWMTVDDSASANITGAAAVPNSTAAWQVGSDNTTPYINSWDVTIGGTLRQHIQWEYGATFHDTTSYHNDATPTFRTTTSAAGVTAALTSFGPASQSVAPTTTTTTPEMFTADPTMPSQMYSEGDYSHIPGAEAVNAVLDASGTPRTAWWFPFIYLGLGIFGFMLASLAAGRGSRMTSETAQGEGSLLLQASVYEIGLVLFGVMGPCPLWPAYLFPILGLAIVLSKRHWGWG